MNSNSSSSFELTICRFASRKRERERESGHWIQHHYHQKSLGRNDPHWVHRFGIDSALINLEREREKDVGFRKVRKRFGSGERTGESELKSNKSEVHVIERCEFI